MPFIYILPVFLCILADLHSSCALIEDSLLVLENLCEEADFEKAQVAEQYKLAAYEVSKNKELAKHSGKTSYYIFPYFFVVVFHESVGVMVILIHLSPVTCPKQ